MTAHGLKAQSFAEPTRRLVAGLRHCIATGVLTLTCCAFNSGCVFPYPILKSTSLPDAESKLPADLRSSGDEVLVVSQTSTSSLVPLGKGQVASSASKVSAEFKRGNELLAFTKTLSLSSTSGIGLAVVMPAAGGSALLAGDVSKLERLCVVMADGRLVSLAGVTRELPMLDAYRRDAIVAALRGGGNNPFAAVDGPCGASGAVDWPVELRSRVIDFFVRIPAVTPRVESSELVANDLLAEILRNSWAAENDPSSSKGGVMLLVAPAWRGAPIAERPRFLTIDDFDRYSTNKVTVDPDAIIVLLPTYASGSYDVANTSVQSFCLISRDGRAISASGPTYWEGPKTKGLSVDWKDTALSGVRLGTLKADSEFPCIPPGTKSWSDADRAAAIGFLGAIQAPAGSASPCAATIVHALSSENPDRRAASVMVLAVTRSLYGGVLVVPLLLAADDVTHVVSAIKSSTPCEFTASLAQTAPARDLAFAGLELDYVCIVDSDGRGLAFQSAGATDSWLATRDFVFVDQPLRDAIAVVRGSGDYRGSFICSLDQSANWPADMRTNVATFLERVASKH